MEEKNGVDCDGPEVSKQRENATNYFRLVQLTMVEGTNVVRKTILNRLQQRKTLHTILADRRSEFTQRGSGFNHQQLDVLYPASGNADLGKIDMTLWFALARKLRVLPHTYMKDLRSDRTGNINNTTPLLGTQVDWCQDLATIHIVRNNLFHLEKPEMETEIFEDQWNRLTEALYRLDPGLDPSVIERYCTAELNPKGVIELRAMIMEQCLQERCKDLADEVRKRNRIIQLILLVVALVLLVILVAVLVFVLLFKQPRTCDKSLQNRVTGSLGALYFMPREGWGAAEAKQPIDKLHLPTPYIVYTHTAEIALCSVTEECCNLVKNIQYQHMHKEDDPYEDIGIHYLIDSRGIVYEGRNIHEIPSSVYGWNHNITSVAFIGNFVFQHPTENALGTFALLIAYLRRNNFIIPDYTIYGWCELRPSLSPGKNLYDVINDSKLDQIFGHVKLILVGNGYRNYKGVYKKMIFQSTTLLERNTTTWITAGSTPLTYSKYISSLPQVASGFSSSY